MGNFLIIIYYFLDMDYNIPSTSQKYKSGHL